MCVHPHPSGDDDAPGDSPACEPFPRVVHGRQRRPVRITVDCQRLAQRRGHVTVVPRRALGSAQYTPTEDGKAAIAHHTTAAALTQSTHRGKLSPAPCRIRRPMLRRPPHLRRVPATIMEATHADDSPIRKPPHRWMIARVEQVRLRRTCTGGQVYQLHRRHGHGVLGLIMHSSSE
jgi:hypothetical protein